MRRTVSIRGIDYIYTDEVRDCPAVRTQFDQLSQTVFDLSFADWYQNGYWTNTYRPNVLLHHETVVANVSATTICTEWDGCRKQYLQLGTVMTAPAYRNRGLATFLIYSVLDAWRECADAVFLYANDTVLSFYPRFGFRQAQEYQCCALVTPKKSRIRKLDMATQEDVQLLLALYHQGNPFSRLQLLENDGLLLFYCTQSLRDCIYYCEDFHAVVIAEFHSGHMLCYDIFGGHSHRLSDILSSVAQPDTVQVAFGFTPQETTEMPLVIRPFQEDDATLFLLDGKERLFDTTHAMFPLLAHT